MAGWAAPALTLFEAAEEISRADGSAGWCVAICNAVNSFATKARMEVFGPAACWATLLPKANSVEEPGGFCVSGNFGYGFSSSFSRWVMVPARLVDRHGKQWFRAHISSPKKTSTSRKAHGTRWACAELPVSITRLPTNSCQRTAPSNIHSWWARPAEPLRAGTGL